MDEGNILVVVFLRGGVDGLNTVIPTFEDRYHDLRPTLSIDRRKAGETSGAAVPLDDRWALHEELEALLPLYRDGTLGIVHACGSDDSTRSHFEAQDQMEHGASVKTPLSSGWAARWLRTREDAGALSALAFGTSIPESLRGAPSVTAVESLDEIRLQTKSGQGDAFADALGALYRDPAGSSSGRRLLSRSGTDALSLLRRVGELQTTAEPRGDYPDSGFAKSLAQVARLLREDLGLRVAAVNQGGYDTHFGQAALLGSNLRELGDGLAAFYADLGSLAERVTTVCVTEFGRRVYENVSLGTDHGRGSVAFALGGGVQGGRVLGSWPGLAEDVVERPGGLPVTTDFRDLLWEVLQARFGAQEPSAVFPGHTPKKLGLIG